MKGTISGGLLGDKPSLADEADITNYNFYKYYKACDMECDLRIDIDMESGFGSVLSLLVAYENPKDINTNMTTLPTWQSKTAAWTVSMKASSVTTIEGSEPYFFENNG